MSGDSSSDASHQELVVVINCKGVMTNRVVPNMTILTEAGFLILQKVKLLLSEPQIGAIVENKQDAPLFSMAPVVAMLVRRNDALNAMSEIIEHLDDTYYSRYAYTALRDRHLFFPIDPLRERALLLMKPGYDEKSFSLVMDYLEKNQFVVLAQVAKELPEATVTLFGSGDEELKYLTEGSSGCIVVEKRGAVIDLLMMLGPEDPQVAKQIAPDSLRAILGTDTVHNALYGSPSAKQAELEITTIFPDPFPIERTIGIIKPDTLRFWNEIKADLEATGFEILYSEVIHLSLQRAEAFLDDQRDSKSFETLTTHLASGPSLVVLLAKPAAVDTWKKLCGPADPVEARARNPSSLRARFGTDVVLDGFYASSDPDRATADINTFFPRLVRPYVPGAAQVKQILRSKDSDDKPSLNETLVKGLTHLCRIKPTGLDAITELAEWLLRNNPNTPTVEPPKEEEEEAPVVSLLPETETGAAMRVICALGAPGSKHIEFCTSAASEYGFELIQVSKLIQTATEGGSELGRALKATLALGRKPPAHMVVSLLKNAITNAKKSKFILADFPMSLKLAFDFEEQISPFESLVFFEATEAALMENIMAGHADSDGHDHKQMRADAAAKIKSFNDDVVPVLEHYSVFQKVRPVSVINEAEEVYEALAPVFTVKVSAPPPQVEEKPIPVRLVLKKKSDEDDDD